MKTQKFIIGENVKIGFMTFKVVRQATERECKYRPFAWILDYKGKEYQFTPYYGIEKLG
jgi:hypothetical protein